MDEQIILQHSKDLSLNYMKKIGAEIDESHGLYTITIPSEFGQVFGGHTKRITFDPEVAAVHSCELAVPGSNFLAIVMNEIRRQAPVVGGHLKKQSHSPALLLKDISTHNCTINLQEATEEMKIAVRFYFNITVKSIKSTSMLRWVDVDLETLDVLEFPAKVELDSTLGKIRYEKNDKRVDGSFIKSIEVLQNEITPLAIKYVNLTHDNLTRDTNSLLQVYQKRTSEVNQDVEYEKRKLKEFDRKITNARYYDTQEKYIKQKSQQAEKIKKAEAKAVKMIERLSKDKDLQIEQIKKRYRPVVDFSLIAAQAFSYNTSKCLLLFKNQSAEKQTEADFLDPSSTFTLSCELCSKPIDRVHLCINSHLSCNSCISHCVKCENDFCTKCQNLLNLCYICQEGLCENCSSRCNFCAEQTCENHLVKCKHCSQDTCFFCSDSCEICKNRSCIQSVYTCYSCHRRTCYQDSKSCVECDNHFCPKDRGLCAICNNIHCWKDVVKCKHCEMAYSKNCVEKELCKTCSSLRSLDKKSPQVQEIISKDDELKKYKKWECSTNNKYSIFKAKKIFGSKIVVYDKFQKKIVVIKKRGWL